MLTRRLIRFFFDGPQTAAPPVDASLNLKLTGQNDKLPYASRQTLLTKTELAFYCVLRDALGGRFLISCKVRLADVVACPVRLWNTAYGRRISQKHLDFVLCSPETSEFVLAIELNDPSHEAEARKKRDAFVADALRAADIPLVFVKTASAYCPDDLADIVKAAVRMYPMSKQH